MKDREIRLDFICLAQYVTTQSQDIATQDQAMADQENYEVGPRVN